MLRYLVRSAPTTLGLVLALSVGLPEPASARTNASPEVRARLARVLEKARRRGSVRVIVRTPAQDVVLGMAPAAVRGSAARIDSLPLVVLRADEALLTRLAASEMIDDIVEEPLAHLYLDDTLAIIGADTSHATTVRGRNISVAVLDTGVDRLHPGLRVVSEACYSTNDPASGLSAICSSGSLATGAATPCAGSAAGVRGCDHGTHVAGIAAGHGISIGGLPHDGVAPDASIIAINVFSRSDDFNACGGSPPCLLAAGGDLIKGLMRVKGLAGLFNVAAVNMSLGSGHFTTSCDNDFLKPAVDALVTLGVAVVAAAGNDASQPGIGSPACISSVVSVGATTKTDDVRASSQYAPILNLLAPGEDVVSSVPGGGAGSKSGTSMAAPHVTGAMALLQQEVPTSSPAEKLFLLGFLGTPVADPRMGASVARIDVASSLRALAADRPLSADFDADGENELVIWRPENGLWFSLRRNGTRVFPRGQEPQWGAQGDVPLVGDFDRDGRSELVIWRPSTRRWYVKKTNGTVLLADYRFGQPHDVPLVGDFDGDGDADMAIFRPSEGRWWARRLDGSSIVSSFPLGTAGDIPVVGDFDGNGRTDLAVWTPANGRWKGNSTAGNVVVANVQWGTRGDIPLVADLDRDGRDDLGIWRPSSGTWFAKRADGTVLFRDVAHGGSADIPLLGDMDGDDRADLEIWRISDGRWIVKRPDESVVVDGRQWGRPR